jgi:hypothetical protein
MAIVEKFPSDNPVEWLGEDIARYVYHWNLPGGPRPPLSPLTIAPVDNRTDWGYYINYFNLNINGNGLLFEENVKKPSEEFGFFLKYMYKDFPAGYTQVGERGILANMVCAVSLSRCNNMRSGAGLIFKREDEETVSFFSIRGQDNAASPTPELDGPITGLLSVVEFDATHNTFQEDLGVSLETPSSTFYLRIERTGEQTTSLYYSTDGVSWNLFRAYTGTVNGSMQDKNRLGFGYWIEKGNSPLKDEISVSFDWVAHTESL